VERDAANQVERRALTGRAGIVALGTLFSRLLGLVREQVLAAMFTLAATDVFFIAFLIPNTLRQLVAEGAVQNGVLPVLTRVREQQGETRAREFFQALRGVSLLTLLLLTVAGIVCAPWLVELFAGGFRDQPGQFERTVSITRWVFPYVVFMGVAALGVAALNVYRRFTVTAFAPSLLNVAFIISALALPAWFAGQGLDPMYALAFGVLLGGVLQVLAQWPSLRAIGYLSMPRLRLKDKDVRDVLRRMTPVLFGFGIYYVDVVVGRHLLSELGTGAQSYFGYALRLCDFPQGIFVMALQTATLPSLASLAAKNDQEEMRAVFNLAMRLALFVALPASMMFATLSEPIVAMMFQRGEFDAQSTLETSKALFAQGLGVFLVAAVRQLLIVFYALGDTRTPVFVSGVDFLVFFGAAYWLRDSLGHSGVSYAVTLASAVQVLLLFTLLNHKLRGLGSLSLLRSALRTLAASGLAGAAGFFVARASPGTVLPGVLGCATFALVFLFAAASLRSPELSAVMAPLRRRFVQQRS
jgi:putative peptidoglycan lipid II flippase